MSYTDVTECAMQAFDENQKLFIAIRDGSIPILIPIPIMEFPKKKFIVGSVRNLYFKCAQVTQAF